MHEFMPVAIETWCIVCLGCLFLHDLRRHVTTVAAKQWSFAFLMQRLSIAVQPRYAVCVSATLQTND